MWQKSSFSGNGPGNECVEVAAVGEAWRKSSFSGTGPGNDCVEVTAAQAAIALRESDAPGTVIATEPAAFAALIRTVKTALRA
ncbi:DUF397 domain-containing protein [Streptomyces luteoverticillatus]|uniref:DUF397 domain-containing protein n=2 Tax=Streptomyces TaxID=1883 RepID=A0A3S9PJ88_STRLT|nr:DUF397 domain-containing protein [Streptomyces luteoverticillatus]AZQ72401.1 DUF397 domain-containing protein [Streptomyces luteoverticillatus]